MNFLIDMNLPPDLADWLRALGHSAHHVRDVLSPRAPDGLVWTTAAATGAIVVTKGWDYVALAERDPVAQVIIVRCGNLRLNDFRPWFETRASLMLALLQQSERIVELR